MGRSAAIDDEGNTVVFGERRKGSPILQFGLRGPVSACGEIVSLVDTERAKNGNFEVIPRAAR